LADARARCAALPTGNVRSYATGAATVRDRLGRVFTQVGAALDRLARSHPDKTLNSAFDQRPECAKPG
jgi:hypothetical protein